MRTSYVEHINLEYIIENYDAVIFDFDGTLFDLKLDWKSFKDYLLFNFSNFFKKREDTTLDNVIKMRDEFNNKTIWKVYLDTLQIFESKAEKIPKEEGINIFRKLSCVKEVFIVSNNLYSTITQTLAKYDLKVKNENIISLEACNYPKPNPQGLKLVISKLNNKISKCRLILIGDSAKDEEAAKQAKIDFVNIYNLINKLS